MILIIDNYDSFTYNLVDYFEQLGTEVLVKRNDVSMKLLEELHFEALVLSPGPEDPLKANNLMPIVENYLGKIPILGICLGHQAIALSIGSDLVKAERPMHGMLSGIEVKEGILFKNLPNEFEVVRYHSLLIEQLSPDLRPTAFTVKGELMAFESEKLMVCGLQFHPEAILTQYGLDMLRNWLTFYNIV